MAAEAGKGSRSRRVSKLTLDESSRTWRLKLALASRFNPVLENPAFASLSRSPAMTACAADRERHHLLQLHYPVASARQVRGQLECECPVHAQEDLAGGVAPRPFERALHLPQHRVARPGCDRGRAKLGLTEFSGVWA